MGESPPGARASRPHKSWHSLTHLLDPDRTATAPWLCFGRAHAVPAGRAVGCNIAGKLSGNPRDSMRARRPRSRGVLSRWCAGGYPAGDFSESRRAPFGKLPFVREPCPAVPCGSNQSVTISNRPSRRDLGIPSRLTSTPSWSFVVLRVPSWITLFFCCFRQGAVFRVWDSYLSSGGGRGRLRLSSIKGYSSAGAGLRRAAGQVSSSRPEIGRQWVETHWKPWTRQADPQHPGAAAGSHSYGRGADGRRSAFAAGDHRPGGPRVERRLQPRRGHHERGHPTLGTEPDHGGLVSGKRLLPGPGPLSRQGSGHRHAESLQGYLELPAQGGSHHQDSRLHDDGVLDGLPLHQR